MKEDFDETHYFAGYPGDDSMREKAKRLLGEEFRETRMTMPGSHSETSREKMRLYKKGGHVKHRMHEGGYPHDEAKEHKRTHLHKVQRHGLHETEHALEKESHLKRGGHVRRKHKQHHADGGQTNLFPMKRHEESGMKRTFNRHAPETHQHRYPKKVIEGGSLTNLHIPTPRLNVESIKGTEMMRKGGNMHHKKHTLKRASGGTVYEHEMRGEGKKGKVNYERLMKGEHCSHHAIKAGGHKKNPGAVDQSGGHDFKRGGKAVKKYAAGGVGKIRHGAADKFGRPIMRKRVMGK